MKEHPICRWSTWKSSVPYVSVRCQPRSGNRQFGSVIHSTRLTLDFSYCYSINLFLLHLCLKRGPLPCLREWLQLSTCMRLHRSSNCKWLLACMQNKVMKYQSTGQTAVGDAKKRQRSVFQVFITGSSRKTTIFFLSQSTHLKHKAQSNTSFI